MTPIMFAEDTNLFISDSNRENLIHAMNEELRKAAIWFPANYFCRNGNTPSFFKHIYTLKPVKNTQQELEMYCSHHYVRKTLNLSWPTEDHTYGINLLPEIKTC